MQHQKYSTICTARPGSAAAGRVGVFFHASHFKKSTGPGRSSVTTAKKNNLSIFYCSEHFVCGHTIDLIDTDNATGASIAVQSMRTMVVGSDGNYLFRHLCPPGTS